MQHGLEPWPEHDVPWYADAALLSRVVSGGPRIVWGEGDTKGRLALIMDNPGLRESANGVGFVCPTRQALRLALSEAGVPQSEVQVFFLYKARPRRAYDRVAANEVCVPLLLRQVEESPARVLLALGNTVVQALVGGETTVRASRGVPLSFGGRPLHVSYHPLAVWRRPNLRPRLVADIRAAYQGLAAAAGAG